MSFVSHVSATLRLFLTHLFCDCLYGNWYKDVAVGQLPVFGFLVSIAVLSAAAPAMSVRAESA